MGSCIICGADVDGHICSSHEEDVCFEFAGTTPDELTPGRFYRGSVDGFADFGVFVDIGDRVTGLLHRSELDRRLESLDWEPGDQMFVQVKNVRDNGDVDLGWSIRQHESEFRGLLVDAPEGDQLPDDGDGQTTSDDDAEIDPGPVSSGSDDAGAAEEAETGSAAADSGSNASATDGTDTARSSEGTAGAADSTDRDSGSADSPVDDTEATGSASDDAEPGADASDQPRGGGSSSGGEVAGGTGGAALEERRAEETTLQRTSIDELSDLVGRPVCIEGRVIEARQTSGPTVFEVRDETGTVECAAFESAGVRAYPEVDAGDLVRIDGEVEERRGDLQVETESLTALDGDERDAVVDRLESALEERARPDEVDLLADHPAVDAVRDDLADAATAIRRAVFDARPVVVRHTATVDGYVAAAAIEQALIPLVREEHEAADAEYHYVDRRPLDGRVYDMDDAMRDTTRFLDAGERHGEKVPLFVFVNAGSTEESRDSFELLDLYGADRVVVDGDHPDESMADAVDVFVTPYPGEGAETANTTALGANVAAAVNPAARDELRHLPAVSYWRNAPGAYADLAADAGYDEDRTRTLREALALEAFYQAYEDKRELVADLLFGERDLAGHAAEQFRERLDREIRTAEPHLEEWSVNGATLGTLDLDAFTHQYEFPPPDVLLAELADRSGADAVLGIDEDSLLFWSDRRVDVRAVGEEVAEEVEDAGVETRGGRDGHLVFLSGEREAVVAAAVGAIGSQLA